MSTGTPGPLGLDYLFRHTDVDEQHLQVARKGDQVVVLAHDRRGGLLAHDPVLVGMDPEHARELRDALTVALGDGPPQQNRQLLSKLLFECREAADMLGDMTQNPGDSPQHCHRLRDRIDTYRAAQGWSPHGFGGEA